MSIFRDYYLGLTPYQRERFARAAGRSSRYLLLVAYGHKQASMETALSIEVASRGLVKAEVLYPGIRRLLDKAGYRKETPTCHLPAHTTHGQATPPPGAPPSSPAASEAES